MTTKTFLTALAVIALVALAATPTAQAHHFKPIQPGALLGKLCTLNFVFEDDAGQKYIGSAGHCVPRTGRRVVTPELGEFGTVVYWRHDSTNFTKPANATGPLTDFALIAIDPDKYHLVDPSVRYWGGPTGVATDYTPGQQTLHYGQGLFFHATETSRGRVGVLQDEYDSGPFTDWYLASHVIMGGDSGSGLMLGDGKALGVIDTVAVTYGQQPGVIGGPTIELQLRLLKEAGFNVRLVTAPFASPTDAGANAARAAAMIAHCQAQPTSDPTHPNGCIRQQYYSYHSVSLAQNQTAWRPHNWAVMTNSDPRVCPETPWYPTTLMHPCQVHILLVEVPDAFWHSPNGTLTLTHSWRDPAHKVDVLVYDSKGKLLAEARNPGGNHSTITLQNPPKDAYRILMLPTRWVETDFARLQNGDGLFRAIARLDYAQNETMGPSDAGSLKSQPMPSIDFAVVVMAIGALAIWARRRR